jgi:hypothetical protein
MSEKDLLLESINQQLAERGLRRFSAIGNQTKGEYEITGIAEINDSNKRFLTDILFDVLTPKGQKGQFSVRFSANGEVNDGAVFVTVVNGKFAIMYQWRLPLARYTWEVPRGFSDKLDQAHVQGSLGTLKIADLPLGTLIRELGEEIVSGGQVTSITHLGNVAENTGTHNVIPSYFLVMLCVDEVKLNDKLRDPEIKGVELWDVAAVNQEIGGKLCDNHTLTALFLAAKHIQGLPRL